LVGKIYGTGNSKITSMKGKIATLKINRVGQETMELQTEKAQRFIAFVGGHVCDLVITILIQHFMQDYSYKIRIIN